MKLLVDIPDYLYTAIASDFKSVDQDSLPYYNLLSMIASGTVVSTDGHGSSSNDRKLIVEEIDFKKEIEHFEKMISNPTFRKMFDRVTGFSSENR